MCLLAPCRTLLLSDKSLGNMGQTMMLVSFAPYFNMFHSFAFPLSSPHLTPNLASDADDEWKQWNMMGDPVLHIDLRDWADLLLIAPLSAHTLAKLSQGLCDDTLSCVVRAWDFGHGSTTRRRPGKPLLLAPAMNTAMWDHPLTWQQLHAIQGFWNTEHDGRNGVGVITPMTKKLACGEVGQGALASVDTIIQQVRSVIS
mmetsp:Transcript_4445/g.11676  ORF Transcript_4445/g.11676 Transcript_4445/m.11676 type:complete len:200 (-) Transcript_4445:1293-1892(-)